MVFLCALDLSEVSTSEHAVGQFASTLHVHVSRIWAITEPWTLHSLPKLKWRQAAWKQNCFPWFCPNML